MHSVMVTVRCLFRSWLGPPTNAEPQNSKPWSRWQTRVFSSERSKPVLRRTLTPSRSASAASRVRAIGTPAI